MLAMILAAAEAASDHLIDIAQGALIVQAIAGVLTMVGVVAVGRRFLATEWPAFVNEIHADMARLESAVRDLEKSGARLSETDLHMERRLSRIEGELASLRSGRVGA